MMKTQQTFSDIEYSARKRVSRREIFLQKMDALIPWAELEAVIRPHYYAGKRGRPPRGIEVMLRMYLLQVWYNLSDQMAEEEIYDSHAMKEFLRIDFQEEDAPDATTLLGFRHLLEQHGIQKQLFEKINQILEREGMLWRGGSIIDATIIEAPVSTKNSSKSRDGEMKQTKKGNEWHFGMKAHIGADAGTGMVHRVTFTAANEKDIQEAHKLVRKDDEFVNADAGYRQGNRIIKKLKKRRKRTKGKAGGDSWTYEPILQLSRIRG
jgi:IS5 family transposase